MTGSSGGRMRRPLTDSDREEAFTGLLQASMTDPPPILRVIIKKGIEAGVDMRSLYERFKTTVEKSRGVKLHSFEQIMTSEFARNGPNTTQVGVESPTKMGA